MKIFTFCLLIFTVVFHTLAQGQAPILHTKLNNIVFYLDNEKDDFNGINEINDSFTYSFITTKPTSSFILVSEKDSVSLVLRHDIKTVILIVREEKGDTVTCNFSTRQYVKPAIFSDAYKKENHGKTIVQIPEVYELFNVILALSYYGKTDAIEKETDYYPLVMKQFASFQNHPTVHAVDSLLKGNNDSYYHLLKMDSYAYHFNGNRIEKSGVYDRISWGERNELEPFVPLLEEFARQSGFRQFYKEHNAYYSGLITDFTKNVDVATMKNWLEKQFPKTRYDDIKVIFSPLVGFNQSANNFEDNGFKEAQAHINYPFVRERQKALPAPILKGKRMIIAFTELNHSYLNPEADLHARQIAEAFKDLSKWNTTGKPSSNYDNALSCFEEYMNYALVTLFYFDLFNQETFESLKNDIEKSMTSSRGFKKFKEFDTELLRLYKDKSPGKTVADLYPAIISWSAKQ